MVPRVSSYIILALVAFCTVSAAGRALPDIQTRNLLNVPDDNFKVMSSARHLTDVILVPDNTISKSWDRSQCQITITKLDATWTCPGAKSEPACCLTSRCFQHSSNDDSRPVTTGNLGSCDSSGVSTDGSATKAGCCPPS